MIRIPQVRVVDEEGAQLGVMPTPRALEMAQERGLDLVEVAPMASPPVVKFLDFGQYKYELTKREKEAKRKQRSVTFKEVRLSPKIGVGDFDTKVHRAIEFLEDGDRIKVTVRFRGRELTHPELGRNLLARFVGPGQGPRGPGADAAARRQVDAHHDGIDPQAQEPRGARPDQRRTLGQADGAPAPATDAEAGRHRPPRRRRRPTRLRRRTEDRTGRRRRTGPKPGAAAETGGSQASRTASQPRRRQPSQRRRPPSGRDDGRTRSAATKNDRHAGAEPVATGE